MVDRFNAFGAALASFGALFSLLSYKILSNIPLTALGIGMLILGLSICLTPTSPIPRKAVRALIEGSILNLEALLEEFDASCKGYYVPHEDGRVYVYVPLSSETGPPKVALKPRGVVVEEGGKPYLVFLPPASELVRVEGFSDVEAAISEVLVDLTELCKSVKVVRSGDINIEVKGVRGYVSAERFKRVFGSIEACLAACVAAALSNSPVYVLSEVEEKGVKYITLRVCES